MKKSSLLTVALASLVALVGCNKKPAVKKTAAQKVMEAAYFELMEEKAKFGGDFEPDTAGQGVFWDYENCDNSKYYALPQFDDGYIALIPLIAMYTTESEGVYVIHWSNGDQTYTAASAAYQSAIQWSYIPSEMETFADASGYVQYWGDPVKANVYAFDLTDATAEDMGVYYMLSFAYAYIIPEEPETPEVPLRDPEEPGEGEFVEELAGYLVVELCIINSEEALSPTEGE